MITRTIRTFGWLYLAIVISAASVVTAASKSLPTWTQVRQIVDSQLSKTADYHPGDLISQSQVKLIFEELDRRGWKVADQEQIMQLAPRDDELFVRLLRSNSGLKFMRQIVKYPLAIDRVDRLSQMAMGEKNVRALIRGPDGYKMIQYMTSTPYGKNLGGMLSEAPRGADFNKPTGKIYTAEALLLRLNQSYAAELDHRS